MALGTEILWGIFIVAQGTSALNPWENEIFWWQLVPKYSGGILFKKMEYWFGFGIICAAKTYENGILLCFLGKYTYSIHMKVKYFGSC